MKRQQARSFDGRRTELLEILPNIRRFAVSLTGNLADGDDLLQSTVVRLLERGLPEEAALLPWAMKVCRNLWIDEIRGRKVRLAASDDPALTDKQVVSGEQEMLASLSLREVNATLQGMPAEQRAVLELVAAEGYSYKEAAGILEIPIGTVMSRLAWARAALARDQAKPSGLEAGETDNE